MKSVFFVAVKNFKIISPVFSERDALKEWCRSNELSIDAICGVLNYRN